MICNEVKRGHSVRLNGLWNLSCSSAFLDPAILSGLVKNGFYINQCYSMTELAGYGLLNVPQEVPVAREVMEQMRTDAMKKIAGLRTFRP